MYSKLVIDDMNPDVAATGWTALGNDTTGLLGSTTRLFDEHSLEFDKVNGAAGTVYAGAYKTIGSTKDVDLEQQDIEPWDKVTFSCYLGAITAVANVFVRIGTDSSNYLEFSVADSTLQTAGWNFCDVAVGDAILGGTGWDPSNLTYLMVGVEFDAESDTLANIRFERVAVVPVTLTRA